MTEIQEAQRARWIAQQNEALGRCWWILEQNLPWYRRVWIMLSKRRMQNFRLQRQGQVYLDGVDYWMPRYDHSVLEAFKEYGHVNDSTA